MMQEVIDTSGFVLINLRVGNINGLYKATYGELELVIHGTCNPCYMLMNYNTHSYIIHLWVAEVSSLACAVAGS